MKRLLSLLIFTSLLSACSFGALHPTLYNNKVVDLVLPTTLSVESSAVLYNSLVPEDITELTLIEPEELRDAYDDTEDLMEDVSKALNFESEDLEQQATVRGHLETYLSAGEDYLEAYEAMVSYFEDAGNQTDPNRLDDLDPALHTAYNTFTEANNDLVTSLASFVEESSQGE